MENRLPDDQRRLLFERMLTMRRFSETVIDLEETHGAFGRSPSAIGNEGPAAALSLLVEPRDLLCSTHRNHGHVIAMGADPMRTFAEILGRADGLNGGKAGTLHLCDRSRGFLSTSGMVGGSNALAVGAGFAQKRQGTGGIAVSLLGDGTLDEGITYECLNLASLLDLPVLFLCENNAKAGERPSSMLAAQALADIPRALSLATETVDGGDAEAVHRALRQALTIVRGGKPFFLECSLERWPGIRDGAARALLRRTDLTLASNPGAIGGPHAGWLRADPLLRQAAALATDGLLSPNDILALDHQIAARLAEARRGAEASPAPDPASALGPVFG